ncbi:MAG: 1,4-dihydroxy-6-naphthoate synthase [Planctomycetes bacterium]|nr:1,4-dihydroxy-6-naphthoate synthase [Planctomycetota bacterium]
MKGSPAPARTLEVGYSTCPNDTFVFHALVTGLVPTPGVAWRPVLEDVETLNRWAFERKLPVTKISFHAFGHLRESYALLRSGAALGRGCGPLLVARDPAVRGRLEVARVAIPGRWTSAALLLRLLEPRLESERMVEMPFHRIPEAVERGEADAGLIIHESRFTYAARDLVLLEDLGAFWERESGLPIPLGAIIADRRLGPGALRAIETALGESVRHARRQPADSAAYVREHAQELEPEVVRAHIELYVNDFTEDLGSEGLRAVEALFRAAEERGILPRFAGPLTCSS